MTSILSEVTVIFLLVLVNGVFAGAEIAIVALRKLRIEELAEEGQGGARAVLSLRESPERFLATVQVGITVVSATAAAVGGESLAVRLAHTLEVVPWIGARAHGLALALVVAGVSYLSIVLGELVPKSLALRGAEQYALLVSRPLLALSSLARPLVWFLSASANVVLRPFGDKTTFTETRHSKEELRELVEEATRAGVIHPEAGEIAARALELPELTVADVVVPRQDVVAIPRDASSEHLRRILLEQTHTRMPVYEGRIDNIVGYISVKDLLAMAWNNQLIVLEDVLRPAYFVPESMLAVELLKEMRNRHLPFAVVVDEQGGMSGVVTMEDVLEELVGEIFSEHDSEVPDLIQRGPDGSALVNGSTPIRDASRSLGIELPQDGPWTTVAGLCLAIAGRMPATGDLLKTANDIRLEIVDASPRRIRTVRIGARRSDAPRP